MYLRGISILNQRFTLRANLGDGNDWTEVGVKGRRRCAGNYCSDDRAYAVSHARPHLIGDAAIHNNGRASDFSSFMTFIGTGDAR